MISRILTGAALTGMLAAAGCGGGTGSGIAPLVGNSTGGTGAPSSTARGVLSASFLVPAHNVAVGTASNARKPEYISPGSAGIEVLLGQENGGTVVAGSMSWIVGSQGAPVGLVGTPGLISTARLLTPTQVGYAPGAAVTYSYQPSTTLGFYVFTVSITGLATNSGANHYEVGVVLTDANKQILSSNEAAATGVFTSGVTQAAVPIILVPVLATAYLVGPTFVPAVTGLAGALSYELTAYPADAQGYVIPAQNPVLTGGISFSNASWGVKSSSLYVGTATVPLVPSLIQNSNPIPTALTSTALAVTVAGTAAPFANGATIGAEGNITSIAAPAGSKPNQSPIPLLGSTFASGQPVNVTDGLATKAPGSVSVYGDFQSTLATGPGFVDGYTFTSSVNLPTSGTRLIGNAVTVDFTPGLIPIIQ